MRQIDSLRMHLAWRLCADVSVCNGVPGWLKKMSTWIFSNKNNEQPQHADRSPHNLTQTNR